MWVHRIVGGAVALFGLAVLGGLFYFLFNETARAEHFVVWIGIPGVLLTGSTCLVGIAVGVLYAGAPRTADRHARKLLGRSGGD